MKHQGQTRLFGGATPASAVLVSPLSAARWLLVLVLAAALYFFHGFLVPVLAALVIGFASWPLYRRLLAFVGGRRSLAAAVALLVILSVLVVPLAAAASYAVEELRIWLAWAVELNRTGGPTPQWIASLPLAGEWLDERWTQTVGRPGALGGLVEIVSGENVAGITRIALAAGSGLFNLLLGLLFMLIALFFVYRDGASFAEQINRLGERILPNHWHNFSRVVPATISSTVTGMGLIAMGEGVVLGIAYWIAGVPSPVTLGVLTGIMALIPGGAPLSFTLVSLYLVGSGSAFAGLALFAWGAVELFIVDKTLRPKLVGGPIKLPFLPTFFGLVGGVKTMGLLGLFIGPVLMALVVAIWREGMRELRASDPAVAAPPEVRSDRRLLVAEPTVPGEPRRP